jgi:hypothetical protein
MSHYVQPDRADPIPNDTERRLARELRMRLEHDIAAHLAAVREGYSLEGPRRLVSGEAQIPRSTLLGPDRERAIELATEYAWRSWCRELIRHRLRPCGWPAVQQTWLAYLSESNGSSPYVEVDPEDADLLLISVTCEAVPAGDAGA